MACEIALSNITYIRTSGPLRAESASLNWQVRSIDLEYNCGGDFCHLVSVTSPLNLKLIKDSLAIVQAQSPRASTHPLLEVHFSHQQDDDGDRKAPSNGPRCQMTGIQHGVALQQVDVSQIKNLARMSLNSNHLEP